MTESNWQPDWLTALQNFQKSAAENPFSPQGFNARSAVAYPIKASESQGIPTALAVASSRVGKGAYLLAVRRLISYSAPDTPSGPQHYFAPRRWRRKRT